MLLLVYDAGLISVLFENFVVLIEVDGASSSGEFV